MFDSPTIADFLIIPAYLTPNLISHQAPQLDQEVIRFRYIHFVEIILITYLYFIRFAINLYFKSGEYFGE